MNDLAATAGIRVVPDRKQLVALLLGAAAVLSAIVLLAPPTASAHSEFSWKSNYNGIAYGWDNDHAWMIGSYSAVGSVGLGEVASLICSAIAGEKIGSVCSGPVQTIARQLTAGSARLSNHGIWIEAYPHVFPRLSVTFRSGKW